MSVSFRLGFSLISNLLKAIITFATGMMVARGLGPEQYGTMAFLLGTFTAVRQLFDMGSSTAFFTFLASRQRSKAFVSWYFAWLGIQFIIPLLAVGMLFPATWIELFWKSDQRILVILAFVACYMQSVLWSAIMQMGESQRLTHWIQGGAVTVSLVHLFVITIACRGDWLDIHIVFILMVVEWAVASAIILRRLKFFEIPEDRDTISSVFKEYWCYCKPLIPYAWLGFIYEFVDRWLLQTYAGGVGQAYYAVAFQFSAVGAIATSSILNVFWKEIAESNHQGNLDRVAFLYRRVSRLLFFASAAGAGFLAPWSDQILRLTLGSAYVGGGATLMIMFFYPLHQSMGQIGGAMAYATGRVGLYVKNGIFMMAFSIVVTYFILADSTAPLPGFGLGSVGLAVKMVGVQILSVNALAFCLSRSLGIRFDWRFQPASTIFCAAIGLLVYFISFALLGTHLQILSMIVFSGFFYLIFLLVGIWLMPNILGLQRSELIDFCGAGLRRLRC